MTPTIVWICIIFAAFCGVLLGAFIMAAVNLASNADDQMEAFKAKEAEQQRIAGLVEAEGSHGQ